VIDSSDGLEEMEFYKECLQYNILLFIYLACWIPKPMRRLTKPRIPFLLAVLLCLPVNSLLAREHEDTLSSRYLDPVFDRVDVQRDVPFAEVINHDGKTEKLMLDVYMPAGDTAGNRPAILWIHGGGFRYGNDKSQSYIVAMAECFARRGYVCFSIDYRLRNNPDEDREGTLNDALEDAITARTWIRQKRDEFHIDTNRVFIGGGSAGGMIAVNLCYGDETSGKHRAKGNIPGLIDLWGSPGPSLRLFDIDPDDPPAIIVHGTDDKTVPFDNSLWLDAELERNHIRHELVAIQGADHTPIDHMDSFVIRIAQFLYTLVTGGI
jgi:acetyl esterase/lipase